MPSLQIDQTGGLRKDPRMSPRFQAYVTDSVITQDVKAWENVQ